MSADATAAARAEEGADTAGSNRFSYLLGLALAAGMLAVYELLPPGSHVVTDPSEMRGQFFAVMIGFYIAITPMLARMGASDVGRLEGLSASRREILQRHVRSPSHLWLLGVAAVAVGMHLMIFSFVGFRFDLLVQTRPWWSQAGFGFALSWVHIFCFAFWSALIFTQGTRFTRIARELPEVDLLDHSDLAPFVRLALRLALVVAISLGLGSGFHFNWGEGGFAPQSLVLLPVVGSMLVMAFLFPLWGAHKRLRDGRFNELRRVHAALRGEPDALHDSPLLRAGERLGTVDLLAYRAQIQALGTWPVDATSVLRLGLYLGIPLAGWIGGALVERILDAALE